MTAPIDLSIVTAGGFTGRGLGNVTIRDGAVEATTLGPGTCNGQLTESERAALAAAIAKAQPSKWAGDYTPRANPHGYADQVRYTLTVSGLPVSWIDESRESLPPEIVALYELAWGVRERVCVTRPE